MEKLKDPAMLVTVANSIAIVGITAYFYKQMEAQRLEQIKITQTLTTIAKKLTELEKGEQNKGEVLHTLNNQIKEINFNLENMAPFEMVDNMDIDINEIIGILEENQIHIERPSQIARPRRSGDRRTHTRRSEDEERMNNTRKQKTSGRGSTEGDSFNRYMCRDEHRRTPTTDSTTRSYGRGPVETRQRHDTRADYNNSYEEDSEIINQVREGNGIAQTSYGNR